MFKKSTLVWLPIIWVSAPTEPASAAFRVSSKPDILTDMQRSVASKTLNIDQSKMLDFLRPGGES